MKKGNYSRLYGNTFKQNGEITQLYWRRGKGRVFYGRLEGGNFDYYLIIVTSKLQIDKKKIKNLKIFEDIKERGGG